MCWQIPLRIGYAWEDVAGTDTLVITIGEYDRAAWGPGGVAMSWWCSAHTEAHTAARPLYQTQASELTALIGSANYTELARACDQRLESADAPSPHPADQTVLPSPGPPSSLPSR